MDTLKKSNVFDLQFWVSLEEVLQQLQKQSESGSGLTGMISLNLLATVKNKTERLEIPQTWAPCTHGHSLCIKRLVSVLLPWLIDQSDC